MGNPTGHQNTFGSTELSTDPLIETWVKREVTLRSARQKFISRDLFSEPAWDMLLCLLQENGTGKRVAIKELCINSKSPATTALRYLTALENSGLVSRNYDEKDGRRVYISLTTEGLSALSHVFKSIAD